MCLSMGVGSRYHPATPSTDCAAQGQSWQHPEPAGSLKRDPPQAEKRQQAEFKEYWLEIG